MNGRYIDIAAADGSGHFRAYLSTPASGRGPGLVMLQEIFGVNATLRAMADHYAEEGYTVLVPDLFWRQTPGLELGYGPEDREQALTCYRAFDMALGLQDIQSAISALRTQPGLADSVQAGKVGVVGYCLGGSLAYLAACHTDCDVAVGYYGVGIEKRLDDAATLRCPLVLHIPAQDAHCPPEAQQAITQALAGRDAEVYIYPGADHAFARPGGDHFDKPSALMAHQRSVTALKRAIGPHFDLSALWDRHCEYEFASRDVDATMATMVAEPYVNHIPTMTGGVGYRHLHHFYSNFFVNSNPPDTRLVPISRTVGATQVVDEMLFCFTHTCEIPWMLPGVAPTGRPVEIPLVAIVQFRGDKLCHEHIYWDQASVLVQLGLLDASRLPVAGVDTARKLLDETLPSNALMARRP